MPPTPSTLGPLNQATLRQLALSITEAIPGGELPLDGSGVSGKTNTTEEEVTRLLGKSRRSSIADALTAEVEVELIRKLAAVVSAASAQRAGHMKRIGRSRTVGALAVPSEGSSILKAGLKNILIRDWQVGIPSTSCMLGGPSPSNDVTLR
jgi:hypothetical protein